MSITTNRNEAPVRKRHEPRDRMGWIVLALSVVWAAAVFSAWVLPAALFGEGPWRTALPASYQDFAEFANWLPLAAKVAAGNLFPATPAVDSSLAQMSFYPYLVLWTQGALIGLLGHVGADTVGRLLFPSAAFALILAIHMRYVTKRWAVAMTAVSLMGFAALPLRAFLAGLLDQASLNWPTEPDILSFPVPSVTLVFFLAAFYLTVRPSPRLDMRRVSVLTVLWALQSQVHVINAAIGLPFWFVVLSIRLWRHNKERIDGALAVALACQLLIAILVSAPAIAGYVGAGDDAGGLAFLGLASEVPGDHYSSYSYLAYFLVPLGLLGLLYRVDRIDGYELLFKFSPAFLLMAIELFWLLLQKVFHVGIPSDLMFSRIGMPFLHIYYFTPVVYYMCRPARFYPSGIEGSAWAEKARFGFAWIVRDASLAYLPLLLVLLTLFLLSGARAVWTGVVQADAAENLRLTRLYEALSKDAAAGEVLVSNSLTVDILVPIAGPQTNLLPSRFSNAIPLPEAIERMALRAHLLGWSEERFASFMARPSPPLEGRLRIRPDQSEPGLGYWLTLHKMDLAPLWASAWDLLIRSRYRDIDVVETAKRLRVRRILTQAPLPPGLPVAFSQDTGSGILYRLDW